MISYINQLKGKILKLLNNIIKYDYGILMIIYKSIYKYDEIMLNLMDQHQIKHFEVKKKKKKKDIKLNTDSKYYASAYG